MEKNAIRRIAAAAAFDATGGKKELPLVFLVRQSNPLPKYIFLYSGFTSDPAIRTAQNIEGY